MGDPFADLLTQFKGGGPPKPTQLDNKGNQPLSSQYSGNEVTESNSSTSFHPESMKSNIYSKIDDDFEQLFGIKSDKATNNANDLSKTNNPDEFDSAFDLLQKTPEKSEEKLEPESGEIVDEVRDMEVAKLMSLGHSIDKAVESYENGVLYEDVIEERRRRKLQKQKLHPQMNHNNWNEKMTSSRVKEEKESSGDFFSMASGFLNKGKKFMDQLNLFPEGESDSRFFESYGSKNNHFASIPQPALPKRPHRDFTSLAHKTQEPVHGTLESSTSSQNPIEQVQEGDLLGDLQDKLSLHAQENIPEIGVQGNSDAELLDFDESSPLQYSSASTSISRQGQQSPIVAISEIELSGYNEFKDRASEFFKTGDYVAAIQEYEKSVNTLPYGHPLRIISYSNLMASQLKTGQYKESLHAASVALELFPEDTTQWIQSIQNSEPSRTYRDMWPKIVQRRAEAFEHCENFKEALNAYKSLMEKNFGTDKILEGRRRCQQILNPEKPRFIKRPVTPTRSASPSPDLSSKRYENLERVKKDNRKKEEEDLQRHALYDEVHEKIKSWEADRASDIRHLLSTLETVLTWTNWKAVPPTELVMPKRVKVTYLKAVSKTHPDKIPSSLPLKEKMIAESVFSSLSSAWEKFKLENDIN